MPIFTDIPFLSFQDKQSVKSVTSDRSKSDKDSEMSKALEEERKKYLEMQKELDLQVNELKRLLTLRINN